MDSIDYFKGKNFGTQSSMSGMPGEIDLSHIVDEDDEEQLATGQIEPSKIEDNFKEKGKQKIKLDSAQLQASLEYLKLKEMDIPLEKEKLKQRRKERKKRMLNGSASLLPEVSTPRVISNN